MLLLFSWVRKFVDHSSSPVLLIWHIWIDLGQDTVNLLLMERNVPGMLYGMFLSI